MINILTLLKVMANYTKIHHFDGTNNTIKLTTTNCTDDCPLLMQSPNHAALNSIFSNCRLFRTYVNASKAHRLLSKYWSCVEKYSVFETYCV